MRYTLDSNILINLERLYPRDIFPSLWVAVETLAEQGAACICEMVLTELKRGNDDLHTWAKELLGFLCKTAQEEVLTVATITKAHPEWAKETRNEADPCVIAHAHQEGRAVVTEETAKGPHTSEKNLKIPNVAHEYKVPTMRFFDFVKAQGWTF